MIPGKIAVLTSGGDAPGMNAAIRAVVRMCVYNGIRVYGISRGYQGLIEGEFQELTERSVARIINRGGTILRSSRCEEFYTELGRKKAYDHLVSLGITGLVAIGGNGTFMGAHALYQEHGFPVVCIPGSIDNDIAGTDYSIGFDTATNTVVDALDKIRDTATSHNRLFFVEVMGRGSGFIALKSGIAAAAIAVILPEDEMTVDELVNILRPAGKSGRSASIVIVCEGSKSGGAVEIAKKVTEKYSEYETRVSVLGHLQRGGTPSCFDRVIASRMGVMAVEALISGKKDVMAGIISNQAIFTPLKDSVMGVNKPSNDELRIARILSQ